MLQLEPVFDLAWGKSFYDPVEAISFELNYL